MHPLLANLWEMATAVNDGREPDIGDDALIYHGEATWEMWQNHVPLGVSHSWRMLSEESRLCVFLTAKSVTNYTARIAK